METKKNREYEDYSDEEEILDIENIPEAELDLDDEDKKPVKHQAGAVRFRRTWRDTEKYKEMKELYKIINDELYTGFLEDEFDENERQE
ncbi:MAG: hypothetical protein HY356_00805 [Gammaproteobacteria bacterium]|nr:hypothetical protein [Gammaproteobacteria bacterium]